MKLSEKKKSELYQAISTPIMNERVFTAFERMPTISYDARLYELEQEIWKRVHKALNLEGPM